MHLIKEEKVNNLDSKNGRRIRRNQTSFLTKDMLGKVTKENLLSLRKTVHVIFAMKNDT